MRILLLVLITVSLLLAQQKEAPKQETPKPDKVAETVTRWQRLKTDVEQKISQVRQLALELQNMNIQMRDSQLQMMEAEATLQSLLCNKGQRLTMNDSKPVCSEVK